MRIGIAALVVLALAAPQAHAQLFKCIKDGKTVYQDAPCDDAAKQSTVRAPSYAPPPPPAPAAAKPGAPAAAPAAAPTGNTIDIVAGFTICAERVPNFARKYTDGYEAWKARNSAAVSRLSSEPDASQFDARMRQERERPASESIAERCADVATTVQPLVEAGTPKVVQ